MAVRFGLMIAVVFIARTACAQYDVIFLNGGVGDPTSPLIQTSDGNFYGTSANGGAADLGTAFRLAPDRTTVVLHSFAGGADGASPQGGLIQGFDGNFYGVTNAGGAAGLGTLFRMAPDGTVAILHEFAGAGGGDGASPAAALVQANDGNFYGTTVFGGDFDCGTIFRLTPDGTVTILHSFAGSADGEFPSGLVQGSDGNVYGTSVGDTFFRLTLDGAYSVLCNFTGGSPLGIVQASDGNFYGTTSIGAGSGTAFRLTPDGSFSQLHTFDGRNQPASPNSVLIQATDGNLYGTSGYFNSCPDCAFSYLYATPPTLFKMTLDGAVTVATIFQSGSLLGTPIQAADGSFYGPIGKGALFRVAIALCVDTLNLSYANHTLNLGFRLMTSSSSVVWSTWLLQPTFAVRLWSIPIPPVSPVVSFNIPIQAFPNIGDVQILTILSTPAFDTIYCGDSKVVSTAGS